MTKISSMGICMDGERARIHKTKKKNSQDRTVLNVYRIPG